jgi:hypothetical protein
MTNTNLDTPYNTFIRSIIIWGRITMIGAFVLSFLPVLYLSVFHNVQPPFSMILSSVGLIAFVMLASYLIEPISYFPILGISGSYMSWLAGNIFNLRVPVSIVAQNSAGVREGTPEGDIISTLGMGVSVFVNLIILAVSVLLGTQILQAVPDVASEALSYILPAIFGAFLFVFALRSPKIAAFSIPLALILTLIGIPGPVILFILVISTVSFSFFAFKKGWVKDVK